MQPTPTQVVRHAISRADLATIATSQFGDMVKAVVDPGEVGEGFIEFDSMINIRPAQGNRSRGVEDEGLRATIRSVVATLVSDA